MRRNAIIVFIVIGMLIVGGALTTLYNADGIGSILPVLQQTQDASASVMDIEPWQAEQLFLLIGFILFNLFGIGVTIALILWYVNRQVVIARATANQENGQPSTEASGS